MSTTIELRGERLKQWFEQNGQQTVDSVVVFDFGDENESRTDFGVVRLQFASSRIGSAVALIDCSECRVLQTSGRRRSERQIDIARDGIGQHNLARGVDLYVITDEILDDYRALTRAEMHFREDREGWIRDHIRRLPQL